MEIALYASFNLLLWLLSLTVLLPFIVVLQTNKYCRDKWFSFFYAKFISPQLGRKVIPNRKRAFKLLEEEMPDRDISVPLRILEIGVGPGANFSYYPKNSKLTVVDMNPTFKDYFEKLIKKYPNITHERTVIAMAENMPEVEDCSMDVVVSTYTLCSVENMDSVLKEVKRVLKPGGKFLFLEHVAYENLGLEYLLQSTITPLWTIYMDGCRPDRDTKSAIDKAGFSTVTCEKSSTDSLWLFLRPHIIGVATKIMPPLAAK